MHDIWNPWHGCKKCSPGCQNCYMYFLDEQRGVKTPSSEVHKTGNFRYPLSKDRSGNYKVKSGERIRVNMTSDTFLEEADEWRDEMWSIIRKRPDVIFWILTKRPERMADHMPSDWGEGYENVVVNITCENQEAYNKRILYLLDLPAKHKGICCAPLIGPIKFDYRSLDGQIEEISVGGENYGSPRPCRYEWVKGISDECEKGHINFCFYETGTNFWMNGINYYMPSKQKQSVEAWFSLLNLYQHYYDVDFKLFDFDGNPVQASNLHQKKYNLNHCMFCANQYMCNGCSECGNCGEQRVMVSESEMHSIQSQVWMKQVANPNFRSGGAFDFLDYKSGKYEIAQNT